jgi:hypothetical protein
MAVVFVGLASVMALALKFGASGTIDTKEETKSDFINLNTHVQMFEVLTGRLPTDAEGLATLLNVPERSGKSRSLIPEVPVDPWGHPYRFVRRSVIVSKDGVPTQKDGFGLYSCGPDGISNSAGNDADDIHSW